MLLQDFMKYLSVSYFAMRAENVLPYLKEDVKSTLDLPFGPATMLPMTCPEVIAGTINVKMLHKDKIQTPPFFKGIPVTLGKWNDDWDELSFVNTNVPSSGMVQHQDTCVYLRLIPKKQWNRGYCPANYQAHVGNPIAMQEKNTAVGAVNLSVIWNVYNPSYPTLKQALGAIENGDGVGYALGKYLGVVVEKGRRFPLLMYRHRKVGVIKEGLIYVNDDCSRFAEEYIYKITNLIPTRR